MTPEQELELLELEREAAMAQQAPTQQFPVDLSMGATTRKMGEEAGFLDKAAMGLASGATRIAHGLGFGGDDASRDRQALEGMVSGAGPVGKVAEFGTEVGATLLPAAKAAQGVAAVTRASRYAPQFLKSAIASLPGMAAVEGAASGAVLSPEDRLKGAGMGAAFGAGLQQVGNRIGRLFAKPVPQTAEATALSKRGIPVTAGQGADDSTFRGGAYKTIEEITANIPLLGQPMRAARDKGPTAWRADVLKETTPTPGNIRADKSPIQNLGTAADDLNKVYRQALEGKTIPKIDLNMVADIRKTVNDPRFIDVDVAQKAGAEKWINENLFKKLKPNMSAQELFELQTQMRVNGRKAQNPKLRELYNEAADKVYDSIERQFAGSGSALYGVKPTRAKYGLVDKAIDRSPGSGEFRPSTLRSVTNKKSDELNTSARRAEVVFGNRDPNIAKVLGWSALLGGTGYGLLEQSPAGVAAPTAAALVLSRRGASNAMAGRTALQRRMAAELKRGKPATSGALGGQAGHTKEEEQ